MKPVILFVFFLFIPASVQAQKIRWDRMREGSVRHIGAKGLELKIGKGNYEFSLTVFSSPYSKDYCLLIGSVWQIEDDCVVLIKLGNEETIKLLADNTRTGDIDMLAYIPVYGGTSLYGLLTTEKVTYYSSIFALDQEVLNKIIQNGILKIRIQYADTYREKSWRSDRLGRHIGASYELIELQLQKAIEPNKSIEEDF